MSGSAGKIASLSRGAFRSWLALTADEQKAVLLVLGLFLLGLAARAWHLDRTAPQPSPPAQAARPLPTGK